MDSEAGESLSSRGSISENSAGAPRVPSLWCIPLIVLFAVWLGLAFFQGGGDPSHWLPASLAMGVFGVVAAAFVAYPRRPRQLSMVILTLFFLQALWMATSVLWADAEGKALLEATRTGTLLLVFALALVYLSQTRPRRIFPYLLMTAATVLLATCIWRLWWADGLASLFVADRLVFPTGNPNISAALFLIGFWPLLWLAAAPVERAPVRGVALGLATGLLGLAVLTESRSAVYSLTLTTVVVFIIFPIRLRTLLYLIAPGLLLVYAFPALDRYWREGATMVDGGIAARTLLVAAVTAAFIGMIVALLERWIPASGRMKAIFGTVVLTAALAGVIYGSVVLTSDIGGPGAWLQDSWQRFIGTEQAAPETDRGSRLWDTSSSGAVDVWRASWRIFESEPLLGVGAGNFADVYGQSAPASPNPGTAHSLELQTLAETGAVGGAILTLVVILSLGGLMWGRWAAAWRRARERWLRLPGRGLLHDAKTSASPSRWGNEPQSYGWQMAILAALSYWFVHASIDRLWQSTALAVPALLLLAAGLSGVEARAETLWPRWHHRLRMAGAATTTKRERAETDTQAQTQTEMQIRDDALPLPEDMHAASLPGDETVPVRRYRGREETRGDGFSPRRSDQYASKWRRQQRRQARRERSADRLHPQGPLSSTFRWALFAVSLIVIIGAAWFYVPLL